jgi:hypothetical protein
VENLVISVINEHLSKRIVHLPSWIVKHIINNAESSMAEVKGRMHCDRYLFFFFSPFGHLNENDSIFALYMDMPI